jgi:hypothetical protein
VIRRRALPAPTEPMRSPAPATVVSATSDPATAWQIGLESVYPRQVIVADRRDPSQQADGFGISVPRDVLTALPGLTPGIRTPEEYR